MPFFGSQTMLDQSRTSLVIPLEDRKKLEQIAREFGYLQPRGAGAGTLGSISALVCAIARGELRLTGDQPEEKER